MAQGSQGKPQGSHLSAHFGKCLRWLPCIMAPASHHNTSRSSASRQTAMELRYTRAEVATHSQFNNCWVILEGQVLSLPRRLMDEHPGGIDSIFRMAGQDITQEFHDTHHSSSASSWASRFAVGRLHDDIHCRAHEGSCGGPSKQLQSNKASAPFSRL